MSIPASTSFQSRSGLPFESVCVSSCPCSVSAGFVSDVGAAQPETANAMPVMKTSSSPALFRNDSFMLLIESPSPFSHNNILLIFMM